MVGVLSSVATDAGYLILVPFGAAAFASVGRHPLAGMAACFAGVGSIFGVNLILSPSDAMITEITNEAIALIRPASRSRSSRTSTSPSRARSSWRSWPRCSRSG